MGGSSFELGKSIRVVSDDYNNALLVYASPYEYSKIERILKNWMWLPPGLIEASIVEVQLTDGLEFGLEWTFQNGIGNNIGRWRARPDGACTSVTGLLLHSNERQ